MRQLFVITIVALLVTACSGKESRIEKYYQSAESHYYESNCVKAKLEYKNALQIDPNYAPAYVGLGKCLLDQKVWMSAYAHFAKALMIDENNIEARIYSTKLLTLSGEYSEAKKFIQEILTLDNNNSSAQALRGFIEFRTGNNTQAEIDADAALASDSSNLEAITLKSLLLVADNKNTQVANFLEETLVRSDIGLRKSKELRLILATVYQRLDNYQDTARIYQSLVDDFPDDISYLNILARHYATNKQLDAARNIYLDRLEDDYQPDIALEYVSFLNNYSSRDEAFSLLQEYAAQEKISGKVRLALAREYLFLQERETALEILNKLAKNKNIAEQMDAMNEIAFLYVKDGDNEAALALVSKVLSEQPNNIRALITRGKISASNSNYAQAIADFRVVIRLMPGNLQAITELAKTYVADQQPDLAKELIMQSYENNGASQDLAEIYLGIASGETEIAQSIDLISELQQADQTSSSLFATLFNLYLTNNDTAQARQMLNAIDPSMRDTAFAYYHSALINLAEDNVPQAKRDLRQTIDRQPRSDTALKLLTDIYISDDDQASAISLLKTLQASDRDYVLPYIMLSDIHVSSKDFKAARKVIEQAIDIDPRPAVLYQRLATLVSLSEGVEQGMAVIQQAMTTTSEPEILGVDLAVAHYRIGQREQAITTLTQLLQNMPDSVMLKTQLAYILTDEQTDNEQIERALELTQSLQDAELFQVQSVVGWVNYQAGNYSQAIDALKRALKFSPNNAELNYQLGLALMDSGSLAEAEIFLAKAAGNEDDFKGKQDAFSRLKQLRTM